MFLVAGPDAVDGVVVGARLVPLAQAIIVISRMPRALIMKSKDTCVRRRLRPSLAHERIIHYSCR